LILQGDIHDGMQRDLSISAPLDFYSNNQFVKPLTNKEVIDAGGTLYSLTIYPSKQLRDSYDTRTPALYTCLAALVFAAMIGTFLVFNRFIFVRNRKVVMAAVRSRAIVASIFPTNIRDRLLEDNDLRLDQRKLAAKSNLRDFLSGAAEKINDMDDILYDTKPIADLFPEVSLYGLCVGLS
jgi:hypothetical protein